MPNAIAAPLVAPPQSKEPKEAAQGKDQAAAQQFEALILQQLVKILRESAGKGGMFGGGGPGGDVYAHMIDEAFASEMAKAGGLGLAKVLQPQEGSSSSLQGTVHRLDMRPPTPSSVSGQSAEPTALGRAAQGLTQGGAAARWKREGVLLPSDLSSRFSTQEAGGVARFNVRDARGYEGYAKCNLFAFELTRRAGFQVPVVGRAHGWGYPGPTEVVKDTADGELRQQWGRVVRGESAEGINAALATGQRAFLVASAGSQEKDPHMAVVGRVHRIEYDARGELQKIVFGGWDTGKEGAAPFERRTWTRSEEGGEGRLALVELQRASRGAMPEKPLSSRAGESLRDQNYAQVLPKGVR